MMAVSTLPEIFMKAIWINEQLDPSGILYACIACTDEQQAQDCYQSFQENLTPDQRSQGWQVRLRSVQSWDEVPVSALKLN
jgi:hypothetical protein